MLQLAGAIGVFCEAMPGGWSAPVEVMVWRKLPGRFEQSVHSARCPVWKYGVRLFAPGCRGDIPECVERVRYRTPFGDGAPTGLHADASPRNFSTSNGPTFGGNAADRSKPAHG